MHWIMSLVVYITVFMCGIVIGHFLDDYIYYISKEEKTDTGMKLPIIEVLNGILYIIVFSVKGFNVHGILYCLMTSTLVVISIVDERIHKIPLICNCFLFTIGLCICVIDFNNITEHLIGMICVSFGLFLLHVFSCGKAIGGGDIKLMGAAGLIIGWKLVLLAFFLSCIIGVVFHVLRMKLRGEEHLLAMGPYLSVSIWICALWGVKFL